MVAPKSRLVVKDGKIKAHAHGCTQCSRRYTDTCHTPEENGRCVACRVPGRTRASWDISYDPKPCCRTDSRRINDQAEIEKYTLAGPGPWWRCRSCSRTHPYDARTPLKEKS